MAHGIVTFGLVSTSSCMVLWLIRQSRRGPSSVIVDHFANFTNSDKKGAVVANTAPHSQCSWKYLQNRTMYSFVDIVDHVLLLAYVVGHFRFPVSDTPPRRTTKRWQYQAPDEDRVLVFR